MSSRLPRFLEPFDKPLFRFNAIGILCSLMISASCLLLAPGLMPESYSWIMHTTSESAAQGVEGAWIARLGFITFGLGVLWLTACLRATWGRLALLLHAAFGGFMVATAAFSSRSWDTSLPFDRIEDVLHSVTASGMGLAFTVGVLLIFFQRSRTKRLRRAIDCAAFVAATLIPLSMAIWGDIDGVLQRIMFLIAYVWYAGEAVYLLTHPCNPDKIAG